MDNIEVVIPWSPRTPNCFRNVAFVIQRMKHILGAKVIVVEIFDGLRDEANHIIGLADEWIRIKHPHNKGWACNIGFRQTKSKYILFMDADIVISEDSVHQWRDTVRPGVIQGGSLTNGFCDLSEEESNVVLMMGYKRPFKDYKIPRRNLRGSQAGGAFFISRELFLKIRGFNEGLAPCGGEDSDLYKRCICTVGVWHRGKHHGGHLFHERPNWNEIQDRRSVGERLFRATTQQILTYINEMPRDFGDQNQPRPYIPTYAR